MGAKLLGPLDPYTNTHLPTFKCTRCRNDLGHKNIIEPIISQHSI